MCNPADISLGKVLYITYDVCDKFGQEFCFFSLQAKIAQIGGCCDGVSGEFRRTGSEDLR